jgi:hypothetical protein
MESREATEPDSGLQQDLSASFDPRMSPSPQRTVRKQAVSSVEMGEGDARPDKSPNLAAQNTPEIIPLLRPAAEDQRAELEPPSPPVTPIAGNEKPNGRTKSVSEPVAASAPRTQNNQAEESGPPAKLRYQPLVSTGTSSPESTPVRRNGSDRLIPEIPKEAKSRLFSSTGSQRSEPDEIQIHIGRIEVTAVTQAAPRPAPPPARKSISLDEYLQRGERRPR